MDGPSVSQGRGTHSIGDTAVVIGRRYLCFPWRDTD
jgi:hypothetical protein